MVIRFAFIILLVMLDFSAVSDGFVGYTGIIHFFCFAGVIATAVSIIVKAVKSSKKETDLEGEGLTPKEEED